MSVVTKIISVVLKSVTDDKISNELAKELIGVSIDGVSEFGINKIKDFINGEKAKIEHILSKENMKSMSIPEESIDYVVEEIKDLFFRIDITDEMLRQCRYDSINLRVFLWNEYHKDKGDYVECENSINCCLFKIAQVLIELVRESKNFEKDILTQMSNSIDDANVGLQKISGYMEDNFGKLDENSQTVLNILLTILEQIQKMNMQENETISITAEVKKFQNNKKQDYIKNWNSRLFLHLDNNERPITLADAFILSDFEMYKKNDRIGFRDDDSLEHIVNKFVKYNRTSTMLITGVPGIGKSSITAWIANKYKEDDRVIVLRFRDWDYDDFENGLLSAICNILCCNRKDLSDKILVLDGFDEIKCLDRRNRILTGFINDINDLERSKIIITSRPSYIEQIHFNNNIILSPFNIKKIKMFYKNITGKKLNENNVDTHNLDVLGVPVILYMAIMSNIDITKSATKPELYSRIFAENGGIFDKFCEYDSGSQIMRNPDNITCYLEFLRTTAFKMFEKNELVLSRNECEIPELSFQGKDVSVLEFPIKHLFENTSANIEFIHTSIFEYFVSEYIYKLIDNILLKEEKTLETDLASVLGDLLSRRRISDEILEFLRYRIRSGNLSDKFYIVNETFQLMLKDGMTYYTKKCYKNVIQCETDVFANMLEVIHLWEENFLVLNYSFVKFLKSTRNYKLNLRGVTVGSIKEDGNNQIKMIKGKYLGDVDLSEADLEEADLSGADLSGANLSGANLNNTNLNKANLSEAKMKDVKLREADLREAKFGKADLRRADLCEAKLNGADLIEANFSGATLTRADLRKADLIGVILERADLRGTIFDTSQIVYIKKYYLKYAKIYIEKTGDIIDYTEYCKRTENTNQ